MMPRILQPGNEPLIGIYDATTLRIVQTLDQPTSRKLTTAQGPHYFHSISFSPNGNRIATYVKSSLQVERGFIRVWDAATGNMVLELTLGRGSGLVIHGPPIVVFASEGRQLLYARQFVNQSWGRTGEEYRGYVQIFDFGPTFPEFERK
jgi:WD40 repeat protein